MRDSDCQPAPHPERIENSISRSLFWKRCAAGLMVIASVVGLVRFMLSFPPPVQQPPIKPRLTLNYKHSVFTVAFSPDNSLLAVYGYSTLPKLFDARTGKLVRVLRKHGHDVPSLAFSPDGKLLATAGADKDGSIRIWNPKSGQLLRKLTAAKTGANLHSVAFTPDGAHLVSVSDNNGIKLWEVQNNFRFWRLGNATTDYSGLAIAKNNTLAVCESGRKVSSIKIWDITGKRILRTISFNTFPYVFALSPDGKRVAVSSYDDDVRIWNTATAKREPINFENSYGASELAFSPDGKSLAINNADGRLSLWNIETGKEYLTLKGLNAVAFSLDGKQVAAGFGETIHLWNINQALKEARQAKQKQRESANSDKGIITFLLTLWGCGLTYAGYLFIRSVVGITSRELVRAAVVILIVSGFLLLLLIPLLTLFSFHAAGLG